MDTTAGNIGTNEERIRIDSVIQRIGGHGILSGNAGQAHDGIQTRLLTAVKTVQGDIRIVGIRRNVEIDRLRDVGRGGLQQFRRCQIHRNTIDQQSQTAIRQSLKYEAVAAHSIAEYVQTVREIEPLRRHVFRCNAHHVNIGVGIVDTEGVAQIVGRTVLMLLVCQLDDELPRHKVSISVGRRNLIVERQLKVRPVQLRKGIQILHVGSAGAVSGSAAGLEMIGHPCAGIIFRKVNGPDVLRGVVP